ncbi:MULTISPECIES: DEAD/DEAH box helicase [unclassified Flavobacterium]|uniref:DEAD/DEAH box helicase n=1 Tax=unclassified Flavobacterium TaxID=196869 RepID=UPI00057E8503|nr:MULTISPECIES: DEAD/DEAH box helicase [unclassified Flavobacterium]KIA95627.1 DEAD/DEAH box helicase [Flavobacterium sp. KMS]OUL63453.1 DEAD/DEAH box helicase [Flavobacterium sp. AJR]
MAYELLSEPIRKYIRDKRWEELRPIQNAAITRILTTDKHYILVSRTASGKTEAAFLPVLSQVNFNERGVQVLYISPLIALINDQFFRVEELCKNLEVNVVKWHGEANKTSKEKLVKDPTGIVLMTPESLEAMFVNKPYNVKHIFSNLKFVIIDEIHSFIGSGRGVQLKSLLSRLQDVNENNFRIIGLSATLGDYAEAKKFAGNTIETTVLRDSASKEIEANFRYFQKDANDLPSALIDDLYQETKDRKVLVFPNSRGLAEVVAVQLKKISVRVKGHVNYFSHHSSVDKEVREHIESFAKSNNHQNFCISCTSTLELGIDIGAVDEVVQIDATYSIASLIQRIGRSGRRDGAKSFLLLYATNKWSLLQSLACWHLYKDGFIEPKESMSLAYDLLLHQALSITKGHSGIKYTDLVRLLKKNFAFNDIEISDIEKILNHLIEIDLMEKLRDEVIIGIEGEKIVNDRDFYSAFTLEDNFKVVNAGIKIGEIPLSSQIIENENILLAAKIWKIVFVDLKSKKIEVIRTNDGKKPIFSGDGGIVHAVIRQKMFEILYQDKVYAELNEESADELDEMRSDFSTFTIKSIESERLLLVSEKKLVFSTFTGTKTNRTLQFLFNILDIKNSLEDMESSFDIYLSKDDFLSKLNFLSTNVQVIDKMITEELEKDPELLKVSKWGIYLPVQFQIEWMKQNYFDVKQTQEFLLKMENIITNL